MVVDNDDSDIMQFQLKTMHMKEKNGISTPVIDFIMEEIDENKPNESYTFHIDVARFPSIKMSGSTPSSIVSNSLRFLHYESTSL